MIFFLLQFHEIDMLISIKINNSENLQNLRFGLKFLNATISTAMDSVGFLFLRKPEKFLFKIQEKPDIINDIKQNGGFQTLLTYFKKGLVSEIFE